MSGYYHIHNTCTIIYDKTISRLTKQLKKDKVAYSLLEIDNAGKHSKTCSEINCNSHTIYGGPYRQRKGCLTCGYQKDGRKNSTKTTIIVTK